MTVASYRPNRPSSVVSPQAIPLFLMFLLRHRYRYSSLSDKRHPSDTGEMAYPDALYWRNEALL